MSDDTPPEFPADLPDSLRRRPIYDILDSTETGKRQLALITSQVARGANPGELAQFLELCATYGFDPMAREAWCVVSESGGRRNVMLTVGRNGLRKIAMRQGMKLRGDIVREKDELEITGGTDGHKVVHRYGIPNARGNIAGAWCQVLDAQGVERGFYFAPIEEYRPANPNKWTPWHNQPSVMILAAAERQALGQATPLGGIVAEGELDLGESQALVNGAPAGQLPAGEPDLSDFEQPSPEPEEAEVVPTEATITPSMIAALREDAMRLADEADAVEEKDPARAELLRQEAGELMQRVDAASDPNQEAMDL